MAKYIILTDENDQELHPETSWANILGKPNIQLRLSAINAGTNITITYDTNGNPVINAADAGTIDYEELVNRPIINGSILTGTHKYVEIINDLIDTKDSVGQTLFKIDAYGNIITKTFSTANLKALAFLDSLASTDLTDSANLARQTDLPTTLAELTGDSTHRLVTDVEKNTWNSKSNFSGSYNDLTDKPTIPDELKDLTDDATHRLVTDTEKNTWNAKSTFSGDYNDLDNKPTLFSGNYNDLTNRPTLFSGDYNDLDNKPTLFSGNYNDLTNRPTIPDELKDLTDDATHRLVTDTEKNTWNAKSTFSGNYNDLTNKPTIPDELKDLTEDSTHRTVTDTEKNTWNGKQDAISNLEELIAGAQLGATAIQPDDIGSLAYISKNINLSTDANFTNSDNDIPTTKAIRNFVASISSGVTSVTVQENVGLELDGTAAAPQISINSLYGIPTKAKMTSWDAKSNFSGSWKDLTNKPTLFSGSWNDLTDKPTIPSAVTEATVSGWGFTKNTGTYSKPSDGIPSSDLASAVQTLLTLAGSALQEHQSLAGYATESFVNSSIATQTANFKGTCTTATTEAQFNTWLNSLTNVTVNDYVYWATTDESSHPVYKRYKYTSANSWAYEYSLNNSSFTNNQWAAINSGITDSILSDLNDLYTSLSPVANVLSGIDSNKVNYWDSKSDFDGTWGSLTGIPNWIGTSKPSYSAVEITLQDVGSFANVKAALSSFNTSISGISKALGSFGSVVLKDAVTTVTSSDTNLPTSSAVYTHVSNRLPTFTVSGTTLTIVDNS